MDEKETIKLAIKSLLEVVQTGAKNIEIAVMASDNIVKVRLGVYVYVLLACKLILHYYFLALRTGGS
jgi:hypothetical protein